MDTLSPELYYTERSCYRLNSDEYKELVAARYNENDLETSFEDLPSDDDDLEGEEDSGIQEISERKFIFKLSVSKAFFGSIIGAHGAVRRRIEEETRTTVSVPRHNQDGDVVATGRCHRDVVLAKKHLLATVTAARNKRPYTHFLSIPLASDEMKTNFIRFKEKVLKLCPHLREDIFPEPETLHVTVELLVLTDNKERSEACQKMKELPALLTPLLVGKELRVEASGLAYFCDDPSMVHVLYAKVHNPLLQEVAETASNYFRRTGFTKSKNDSLKLHMTVLNTGLVDRTNQERQPIDVRPILRSLDDFYFGTLTVQALHLSQMGTRGEDGYYLPSAIIQLPSYSSPANCR